MQSHELDESPMIVDLHGLRLGFQTPDSLLHERFEQIYGHLPRMDSAESDIFIDWHIHPWPQAPPPPPEMPVISEGALVSYYGTEQRVAVRLPKYGLIMVDLANGRLSGVVTRNCLEAYGVFEDVLLITLAPLYRRRGWFPLHAFAAVSPGGQAALITGAMGSGKTTTGLALLSAGWKLLSNDSPLLTVEGGLVKVLAYPGQLSAFDDSLARFKQLRRFTLAARANAEVVDPHAPAHPSKRVFRAEEVFDEPWAEAGIAAAVFFPQVVPDLTQSELADVPSTEALLQLMPQAVEGWDKPAIGQSLALLGKLVEQARCHILRLSPQVEQLPAVIERGMRPNNLF